MLHPLECVIDKLLGMRYRLVEQISQNSPKLDHRPRCFVVLSSEGYVTFATKKSALDFWKRRSETVPRVISTSPFKLFAT